MDIQRDKELLEAEIKRLGCESLVKVTECSEDSEGLQLEEGNWCTVDLDISATLANWRKLPDNAGPLKLWEVTVDVDWDPVFEKNKGVEWS